MHEFCAVSCGTCKGTCENGHPDCEFWASIGECDVNPGYMWEYCKLSCGTCDRKLDIPKNIFEKIVDKWNKWNIMT